MTHVTGQRSLIANADLTFPDRNIHVISYNITITQWRLYREAQYAIVENTQMCMRIIHKIHTYIQTDIQNVVSHSTRMLINMQIGISQKITITIIAVDCYYKCNYPS